MFGQFAAALADCARTRDASGPRGGRRVAVAARRRRLDGVRRWFGAVLRAFGRPFRRRGELLTSIRPDGRAVAPSSSNK
jgi:hypothetical protein